MTGSVPGSCLDCGEREQATAFGLCDACSDARTERVRASLGSDVNRETVDTADTSDSSGTADTAAEPDRDGQLSLDAF